MSQSTVPTPLLIPHPQQFRARVRRSLDTVFYSSILAGLSYCVILGAPVPLLAKVIGLDDRLYGIVAAIPALTALIQLPVSMFLQRFGHAKLLMITSGYIQRLSWVCIGSVPLLFGATQAAVIAYMTLMTVSFTAAAVGGLSWQALVADIVPPRRRGRYWGARSRLMSAFLLLSGVILSFVLPQADDPNVAWVLLAVFGAATFFGLIEVTAYFRVHQSPPRTPTPAHVSSSPAHQAPRPGDVGLLRQLAMPLADRRFAPTLISAMCLAAATAVIGPFLWRHFLDGLQIGPTKTTLILQVAPLVATLLAVAFWGRMLDRFGLRTMLIVCVVGGTLNTMAWPLVTAERWWLGLLISISGQVFWAGVDLALLNVVLRESARPGGNTYAAVFNTACAAATFLAGVVAGEIAKRISGTGWVESLAAWHASVGLAFSPYMVLLAISVLIRFATVAMLLRMPVESPYSTLSAVRTMGTGLYSSVAVALSTGMRTVMRRRPPDTQQRSRDRSSGHSAP